MGIALLTKDGRPIAVNAITEKTIGYNFDKLDHADPRSFAVPEDRALDEHQIHLNWLVTRLAVAFHL